jgi:hypothetical protein
LETWLAERVTPVAVAWVLGAAFLRFSEDNSLIELRSAPAWGAGG